MIIHRLKNWEKEFDKTVSCYSRKPFKWGTHDCIITSANILHAITGISFLDELKNDWRSALEARKYLKPYNGSLLAAVDECMQRMGIKRKDSKFITRGNPCICDEDRYECLGIFNGVNVIVPGETGFASVHCSEITTVWNV